MLCEKRLSAYSTWLAVTADSYAIPSTWFKNPMMYFHTR